VREINTFHALAGFCEHLTAFEVYDPEITSEVF
jgi:hypothetical protein